MGANPTQAMAIVLMFLAMAALAEAFADVSMLYGVVALLLAGGSCAMFLKCKPLEHQD